MATQPTHSDGTKRSWTVLRWQDITRADDQPYLRRLILFRCPWFAVYVHQFLGNDDACLHDHPWAFMSLILWGGYWETVGERHYESVDGHRWADAPRKWHGIGSVLFRSAEHAHRVELDGPCWTLVVTGKKRRGWGFFTRFGWIPWHKYSHAKHCE